MFCSIVVIAGMNLVEKLLAQLNDIKYLLGAGSREYSLYSLVEVKQAVTKL